MSQNVYSVSEVNAFISGMFSQEYALRHLSVSGEVSNLKYHTSGHVYFTLKDKTSQMACVMFRGQRLSGLNFRMQDGDHVVVTGYIGVYERDGKYQLYANQIERAGAGILYERYLALKKKLEEEGLFAPEHKKPIPKHVRYLGVVTAPTGAAVQDIRRNAHNRNPYVQLYLYPAKVQGEGAAESVVTGIRLLDSIGCDCIIIGRGGGSIEDLWAFNEEIVVRAIYACSTPIISAVGHETDTTLADLAADLRVATPTEAAVQAVEDIRETFRNFDAYRDRLDTAMRKILQVKQEQLAARQNTWRLLGPANQIREKRQRLDETEDRLADGMRRILEDRKHRWNDFHRELPRAAGQVLEDRKHRLALLANGLDGRSPVRKLAQGYSYVAKSDGSNVSSIREVQKGDRLHIEVTDGVIESEVLSVAERKRG